MRTRYDILQLAGMKQWSSDGSGLFCHPVGSRWINAERFAWAPGHPGKETKSVARCRALPIAFYLRTMWRVDGPMSIWRGSRVISVISTEVEGSRAVCGTQGTPGPVRCLRRCNDLYPRPED